VNVNEKMLDAAIRKAVEAGLLPRRARHEDRSSDQELIRYILQAALDTLADPSPARRSVGQFNRHTAGHRFADTRDKHWSPRYVQR